MLTDDPIFGALSKAEQSALLARAKRRQVRARETVLSHGDPADWVYLLLKGAIRIFHSSEDDVEVALMFCRPPSLFGEMEVVLGKAHMENVDAIEDSELLCIPARAFLDSLDKNAAFTTRILRDQCAKLAMASHNQHGLAFQTVHTRLATLLMSYAITHGQRVPRGVALDAQLTQDDMAHALGITRRAVAKEILRWQKAGVIARADGRYVISKMAALAEEAAPGHIGLDYNSRRGLTIVGRALVED